MQQLCPHGHAACSLCPKDSVTIDACDPILPHAESRTLRVRARAAPFAISASRETPFSARRSSHFLISSLRRPWALLLCGRPACAGFAAVSIDGAPPSCRSWCSSSSLRCRRALLGRLGRSYPSVEIVLVFSLGQLACACAGIAYLFSCVREGRDSVVRGTIVTVAVRSVCVSPGCVSAMR